MNTQRLAEAGWGRSSGSETLAKPGSAAGGVLRFCKDALIYAEGDPAFNCYVISSGIVRTCRYSSLGVRQVTGFHFPGDVFGLAGEHYVSSAEAVTDVQIERHDRRELEGGEGGDHRAAAAVLTRVFERAESRIRIIGTRGAIGRLAAFLLAMPVEGPSSDLVRLPMPRSDVADFIAIDNATLSRTFSRFVRLGLLVFRGAQVCQIRDRGGLECLAEGEETPSGTGRRSSGRGSTIPKPSSFSARTAGAVHSDSRF